MSYPGHMLEGGYPFVEMQFVYSTAQTDCANVALSVGCCDTMWTPFSSMYIIQKIK